MYEYLVPALYSTKKLPTWGRGVSKVWKNCRRRLWTIPIVGAQDGKSLIVYGKSELVDKNLHSTSICEEFQTKIFLNPRILLPSVLVKITAARDLQVLRVLDV